MKSVDMEIDGYVGISIGGISAAYADNCLTAEEAIQIAHGIASVVAESNESSLALKIGEPTFLS